MNGALTDGELTAMEETASEYPQMAPGYVGLLATEARRLRAWLAIIHQSHTDAAGLLRTMAAVALEGEPVPGSEDA